MKYYAFDIETTGLDPKNDRIIELALITPESSHSWLINPGIPMPDHIARLTGITQRMVNKDGVPFGEAWQQFVELLPMGEYKMVGHNAVNFDAPFMAAEEFRATKWAQMSYPLVDSAALFKALKLGGDWWPPKHPHAEWAKQVLSQRVPGLKFNLAHCAQTLNIPAVDGLHRAEADATLTLQVFHKMLERYPEIEAAL